MKPSKKLTFEERCEASRNILKQFPERIPTIVDSPLVDKKKFLVPYITVSSFMQEIRKHTKLGENEGLYIFVKDVIPSPGDMMYSVYERYKDADGFLYVTLVKENTFGAPHRHYKKLITTFQHYLRKVNPDGPYKYTSIGDL